MKVVFAGGGTAGHINPALAIAELIKKREPDSSFLFASTEDGMEHRLITSAGFPVFEIKSAGIKRSLSLKNIKAFWYAATAPRTVKKTLRLFSPDVVIGTGGYLSYPVLRAAQSLGIPTVLHESNAYPGLVVRKLSEKADCTLLHFADAEQYLPHAKRTVTVGNPVRDGFDSMSRTEARRTLHLTEKDFCLLSFGGSLGAARINELMFAFFEKKVPHLPNLRCIHSTGKNKYADFLNRMNDIPSCVEIKPYIDEMPLHMAASDLVVCRAGASTVAELIRLGRASVLIPYPQAAGDHQTFNAQVLGKRGAAVVCPEKDIDESTFFALLENLIEDKDRLKKMGKAAFSLYHSTTNEAIYREIIKTLPRKS